jgi:hypothetical protein
VKVDIEQAFENALVGAPFALLFLWSLKAWIQQLARGEIEKHEKLRNAHTDGGQGPGEPSPNVPEA